MKTYHILNGDALKDRFPINEISGEVITMRECLVDGPTSSENIDDFFRIRAKFIRDSYGDSEDKYRNRVIPEITKISNIANGEVNLWFEDDLFCQVNLWFVCSQLYLKKGINVNLVRPNSSLQYGFGGLSKDELIVEYHNRISLTQINVNQFTWLWFTYQKNHVERLLKLSVQVGEEFPFVKEAIIAQIEREPIDGKMGRPEQAIFDIIKETSSKEFGTVFMEFCKREPIYGFGDLQFKRIFDSVLGVIS